MDDFDKQLDRQQKCNLLADFINEHYVGKICEVQNVFLVQGSRIPYIGIVNKATVVVRRKYNLSPNFYVDVELRTAINTELPVTYQEVCSVHIPPNPYYIQTTCNDIANVVLQMDKTWKEMCKMINSVKEMHVEYHKHDTELGKEWQIRK